MQKRHTLLSAILALLALGVLATAVIFAVPSLRERAVYHIDQWLTSARMFLNPPENVGFSPAPVATLDLQATQTALAALPSPTPTQTPVADTPIPTATSQPTATPLPETVSLDGVTYFTQHGYFNYCAPANLAMALSYWGWEGAITEVAAFLKPYDRDKNVMPYEMEAYVEEQTGLQAVTRAGGSLDTLRRFLSAGYPVLVETGVFFRDLTGTVTWMGHYRVVTGYDDARQVFIVQDSYIEPNYEIAYAEFIREWRSFNFVYLVIYPPEQEAAVNTLLGADADEMANATAAYQLASNEVVTLQGIDQFFAWYNVGTNLLTLQDYAGAASAYDQAFTLYNTLPTDAASRPFRILWYETGAYKAYYYMGRYNDVINLATNNSIAMVRDDIPALEESYYWRGLSYQALGDTGSAIADFRTALQYHPDWTPALDALNALGVTP